MAVEIEQLFFGMVTNTIGQTLLTGFSQIAKSEPVRKHMIRGVEISGKHAQVFSSILSKEDIPSPIHWDGQASVTDSTVAPFSDKLMMFHTTMLNAAGVANYAMSLSSSPRHDLVVNYGRLDAEIADYTEDSVNIMIENGWFEEPPRVVNRRELINEIKH